MKILYSKWYTIRSKQMEKMFFCNSFLLWVCNSSKEGCSLNVWNHEDKGSISELNWPPSYLVTGDGVFRAFSNGKSAGILSITSVIYFIYPSYQWSHHRNLSWNINFQLPNKNFASKSLLDSSYSIYFIVSPKESLTEAKSNKNISLKAEIQRKLV